MPVTWSDEVDDVLASDLTAVLSYATPAGGAVVTPVSPIGLRDRQAGTVGFTTSRGFGRKLERIRRDPRVALTYHAREHGFSQSPLYVHVQGRAALRSLAPEALRRELGARAEPFMGPARSGRFWDRWLREYYQDRLIVDVTVTRILVWPDLDCGGEPEVAGEPLPAAAPRAQPPPARGGGPRLDSLRAARRLRALDHCLLAFLQADGYPLVVPVVAGSGGPDGVRITTRGPVLPPGGRRAGLVAHSYRCQLVGLGVQQHTGWLTAGGATTGVYAPHTVHGFRAPANKTLLLLANGLLAKRGVRAARRSEAAGGT
jgi:nitroimidazol reductase NimA-like FMN-containing flavoprotein (pyridoxamine 5'-phosphate oxidase superfamily)